MGFFDFFIKKNGEVITKHPRNKDYILSIENYKEGVLDGYCIYYKDLFSIDQISREGPYVDGKRHGFWKFYPSLLSYGETKSCHEEGMYENDKREGPWTFKTIIQDSSFEYTINYKNGGIDGPWIDYFFNNKDVSPSDKFGTKVQERGFYRNGKKHGLFTSYWTNENILNTINYKNDLRHGEFKEFTSKGEIVKISNYNNGTQCGYHFENGFIREYDFLYPQDPFDNDDRIIQLSKIPFRDLWDEGNYDDEGRRQGIWKKYHKNGTLMSIHNWKDDKRVGVCEHYDEDGNLRIQKTWKDGEVTKEETF